MRAVWRFCREYLATIVFVAAITLGWEAFVRITGTASYLLPAPSAVFARLVNQWQMMLHHAGVTLTEVAAGFALGASVGVFAAAVMHRSSPIRKAIGPLVVASQTFPKEALAPLFIVLLGPGLLPKVLVAALISFFPMTINTMRGLSSTDPLAKDVFVSLAATRDQMFWKLEVPSALPFVFTGLRMSITLSVIGAVVGEFVGASEGLGYLTQLANDTLQTDLMFASLLMLGTMGVALYGLVATVESLFFAKR